MLSEGIKAKLVEGMEINLREMVGAEFYSGQLCFSNRW